ncbi:ornithine aminotransferase-like protein [Thermochaetoides thermophila DSM 1495]|uniref:Ornithine aminotransferase n=1 Tax=Chaetomium thermophilum (strain DSM 1495 / CBS 144.50 / IMI 039719) TaxID=759272 RepID=G0SFI4_CHATD|nr:ornithine aminotransferase-like protein [Thermochaetoides thermophila DSM 1495]EGS17749.1 ornithine aminotransferase-like protein [Thermochaetoides thermophila DSM 1495]
MAPHAEESTRPHPVPQQKQDRYHSPSTTTAITSENTHAAHNYHPLPIVFSRAQGVHVWDPEGRQYLDFLSAYSAVNQGHCHPALVQALSEQASRLTLSSRAFHNDVFPVWAEKVTKLFGYDMVLPMNTGAEAVETAVKVARKWAYKVKGVPQGKAMVWSVEGCFHGRTMTAVSLSVDPESRENYGPYLPGVGAVNPKTGKPIRYNMVEDIEEVLNEFGKETAAVLVEPIQGEAGVVVPDEDYLAKVHALCKKHNVLLICDEIQTGIARTGRMLCSEWSGIRPDMVTLGKAISGGMYPVSCVLADKHILGVVEPGTHGSTYGGNPLGCAVSIRALELVIEEGMVEKAERLGRVFREGIEAIKSPIVQCVRGKGLLNAVVIDESKTEGRTAWDLCLLLKEKGVLAKPTHGNIIRFAPPLVITEEQLRWALEKIAEALKELPTAPKSEDH